MADENQNGLVRFIQLAGRLKRTVRTGWVDRGVPAERVESVADHSFRIALMAWLAAAGEPSLKRDRVLILALIHDLAEALTGDLTPYDLAEAEEHRWGDERHAFLNRRHRPSTERAAAKRAAEAAAIAEMSNGLSVAMRDDIAGLWRELEERTTPEARFVKQVDKLETYLQSIEYAAEHPGLPVDSFAAEVSELIDIPSLVALRDAIRGYETGTSTST